MNAIETFTGKLVEPMNLPCSDVELEDIAHALSMLCRYNGHSSHFYSVAEHSVHCAEEALDRGWGTDVARWCLLHDAGEAYLADVAAPLKPLFPGFTKLENVVMGAVAQRFNLYPKYEPPQVKKVDRDMLVTEAFELLRTGGANLGEKYTEGTYILDRPLELWTPSEAKTVFLHAAAKLHIL